jgi:hypothetical protein
LLHLLLLLIEAMNTCLVRSFRLPAKDQLG